MGLPIRLAKCASESGGNPCAANSPRAEQAEQRLLFRVQTEIACTYNPQMSGAEILDRAPVEVLLDDRGAHVRGARNRRRVPEPLADGAHHRGDGFLRRGLALLDAP